MITLNFSVDDQLLTRTDENTVAANSHLVHVCEFSFSSEWNGRGKVATFKKRDLMLSVILDDDACTIPPEILQSENKIDVFELSVCGADGNSTITSTIVRVPILAGTWDVMSTEITPTLFEQIMDKIDEIEKGEISPELVLEAVTEYMEAHPLEPIVAEDVAAYFEAHKSEFKGDKGDTGATPSITATAEVNNAVGTPSVTVTKTGTAEAPNLNFAFQNLKGAKGDTGATPTISAAATVDNTTGTPAVNVTKTGTDAAPEFTFAFSGLKGPKGDPGESGDQSVWEVQGILGAKNLLEYPYNMEGTGTSQNVSCTVNDDGSLSFTGVTTSNTVDFNIYDTTGKSFTLDQGEYILTGSSAYVVCFLFLRRTSDNTVEVSTTMNNTLLEIDSTTAERIKAGELKICIRVRVLANANLDGFKVYPMIRYSSDTDTTWRPYAFSNKEITERVRNARGIIKINASDGIEAFYEKMTQAFNSGNYDVYISKGDYIYTNTFVDSIRANNKRGVPVGNGCKYYFESGANLICDYTGENKQDVVNLFSPLDTQSMGSDFEIYNLHLVSKNTVYAFHDEANAANNFCRHVYRNCYIELDNSNSEDTTYISKALGGGLGKYEEIIIENCVFKATNPNKPGPIQEDASYHGANSSTITDASIIVTGCWFDGTFRTSDDSSATGPYPRIIYTGNSAAAAASIPNTWENHSWNNEIRATP